MDHTERKTVSVALRSVVAAIAIVVNLTHRRMRIMTHGMLTNGRAQKYRERRQNHILKIMS